MKKIISLLMALTLVLGLAPATAHASGDDAIITPNNSYYEAVKFATDNDILLEAKEIDKVYVSELRKDVTRGEFIIALATLDGNVNLTDKVTGEVTYTDENGDTMVFGVHKCKDLADVDDVALYNAVAWAFENGITTGYPDGEFKHENVITREETAAFVQRYGTKVANDLKLVETGNLFFYYDADVIEGRYSEEPVEWCLDYGIMHGYQDGRFGAGDRGHSSRAEICAVFYRLMENETAQVKTTLGYAEAAFDEGYVKARLNKNYMLKLEVTENMNISNITLNGEWDGKVSKEYKAELEKNVTVNLMQWIPNLLRFSGVSVDLSINGNACTYEVIDEGVVDGVKTILFVPATPDDVALAKTVGNDVPKYEALISTSAQEDDKDYVVVTEGTEVQFGTKYYAIKNTVKVVPEELDVDVDVDNINPDDITEEELKKLEDLEKVLQEIKNSFVSETKETSAVRVVLKAGSAVAVDGTVYTLDKTVSVELTGIDAAAVEGIFEGYGDTDDNAALAEQTVKVINEIIKLIDEAETVGIAIDFE